MVSWIVTKAKTRNKPVQRHWGKRQLEKCLCSISYITVKSCKST